jgi:replicative DNA helicase
LAARLGKGKTSLALFICRNIVLEQKNPIAFFTLELSSMQLFKRFVSIETGIAVNRFKKNVCDVSDRKFLYNLYSKLSKTSMFFDDCEGYSLIDLCEQCRLLKSQQKIELIIIDYLQLIDIKTKAENCNSIELIMYTLNNLAKELDIPILVLSQLSRKVEERADKRPQLSDLNPDIVKYADVVCFLYRPGYYQILEDEEGNDLRSIAEIIFAKSNDAVEDVRLGWDGENGRFSNL